MTSGHVMSDLEHCCLRLAELIEGRLPSSHFYNGAAQRPDVRWLAVPTRPFIYDFRGHVL